MVSLSLKRKGNPSDSSDITCSSDDWPAFITSLMNNSLDVFKMVAKQQSMRSMILSNGKWCFEKLIAKSYRC